MTLANIVTKLHQYLEEITMDDAPVTFEEEFETSKQGDQAEILYRIWPSIQEEVLSDLMVFLATLCGNRYTLSQYNNPKCISIKRKIPANELIKETRAIKPYLGETVFAHTTYHVPTPGSPFYRMEPEQVEQTA